MKSLLTLSILFVFQFISISQTIYDEVGTQLIKKDNIFNGRFPVYTVDGKWIFSEKPNWFSGFTSGELWHMYDITGKAEYKRRALVHADSLLRFASLDNTHDLGFIFFNSCVRAYQHTGIIKYRDAAIQAARMLVKRFNKKGNFIRAWGKLGTDDREGWMIIDTMMNLELLFWASKETGDYSFYDIAYKHAIICMQEHIRPDYSSYHVVIFDPVSGSVIKKQTHQGYGDETTWARGQAWGVYGFALAYKYTRDERFLNVSKKMADHYFSKLQIDLIPFWDLDLKGNDVVRDASASAIVASGLFLLAELEKEKGIRKIFKDRAERITDSLRYNYLYTKSNRQKEEGILLHTVYNYAKKYGIDESYPAGDFYFIECLKKQYDSDKSVFSISDNKGRSSYLINDNWYYLEDGITDINRLTLSAQQWINVNLPHTWNKTDALDQVPGYRRNISWYEKEIFIPNVDDDRILQLHFEGVNNKAEIYINGKLAGSHYGAYVGFNVNITSFVKKGERNQILVKADNSFDPFLIPSQKSDFIIYGGITRNVWLNIFPKTSIERILVSTPVVTEKKALTNIKVKVGNANNNEYTLEIAIKDHSGKAISKKKKIIVPGDAMDQISVDLPEIANPKLWAPENPYLYTVDAILFEKDKVIDRVSDKIGYRWYEFREHDAFYLNGTRLLLRGTHRHEELSGYGNALPDSIHRKDIEMIKSMGANFIRLAHYPQAPEVYRACDELGLLVWDENPWCRGGVGPAEWQENTKNIFSEMILQNYNHPSIILWSIGNESDWLPDFTNGDSYDSLLAFAKTLHNIAKNTDPYRLTVTRKFPAAQNVVDVFSPSIWSGWYSDVYKNYEKSLIKARDANKRFIHAEFGGDSHVGRHNENPISGEGKITTSGGDEPINKYKSSSVANIGDWSESYIVDLFDWYLHITENLDKFTGSAQWIFRDFITPLRPENPIPYVNQKGLVDMNNNPKDAYYVFKSYWSESPKFCYIESHTWLERKGRAGEKKEVNVFSNCSDVELIINGSNQGRIKKDIKKYPASGLSWNVQFVEGENIIRAIGYEGDEKIAEDSLNILYSTKNTDKPDNLILSKERSVNGDWLITATAVDKNGNMCIDLNTRVYFTSLGGGKLLDNLGTPTGSSIIELANGKAQILFQHIPFQKGVVEVRSQEYKGTYITIED